MLAIKVGLLMKVIIRDKYTGSHEVGGLKQVTGTKFDLAGINKQSRGLIWERLTGATWQVQAAYLPCNNININLFQGKELVQECSPTIILWAHMAIPQLFLPYSCLV